MKNRATRLLSLTVCLVATAALAWNYEYAWYSPAAPTGSGKPGAGGFFGTGSLYEGGRQCQHCHFPVNVNPANPLRAQVFFNPPLAGAPAWDGGTDGFVFTAGHYALNTTYAVNVRMLNEHLLKPDGGSLDNNFAGVFEDSAGTLVGVLTTDTGIDAGNCPATVPTAPATGTTHMYSRCDVMFSRYPSAGNVNSLTSWTFSWRSPASDAGIITFAFGMVDGNGNDRTRESDGGASDDVVMGKVKLLP